MYNIHDSVFNKITYVLKVYNTETFEIFYIVQKYLIAINEFMKHYIYYIKNIFNYHILFYAIYLGRLDTDKTISRTNFHTHNINKN